MGSAVGCVVGAGVKAHTCGHGPLPAPIHTPPKLPPLHAKSHVCALAVKMQICGSMQQHAPFIDVGIGVGGVGCGVGDVDGDAVGESVGDLVGSGVMAHVCHSDCGPDSCREHQQSSKLHGVPTGCVSQNSLNKTGPPTAPSGVQPRMFGSNANSSHSPSCEHSVSMSPPWPSGHTEKTTHCGAGICVGGGVGWGVGGVGAGVGNSVVLGERVGDVVGVVDGARVGDAVGDAVGDVLGDCVGALVGNSVVLGERVGDVLGMLVGDDEAPTQSVHTLPGPRNKCSAVPQNSSHSTSEPGENVAHVSGEPIGPQQHAEVFSSPVGCGVGASVGCGVGACWQPTLVKRLEFSSLCREHKHVLVTHGSPSPPSPRASQSSLANGTGPPPICISQK